MTVIEEEKSVQVSFVKDKETKNTVRFNEEVADDATPIVRNVYINKADLAGLGNPERIEVTITAG